MQKSEQAEKVHFLSLLVLLLQRGSTSTLKSRVTVKVGIRIEISAEYQEASCKLEFIIHSFWKETEVFSKALKIVLDRNEEASEEIQLEIQQNKWDTRIFIRFGFSWRSQKESTIHENNMLDNIHYIHQLFLLILNVERNVWNWEFINERRNKSRNHPFLIAEYKSSSIWWYSIIQNKIENKYALLTSHVFSFILYFLCIFEKSVSKIRTSSRKPSTVDFYRHESWIICTFLYISKSLRAYIFVFLHILNQLK